MQSKILTRIFIRLAQYAAIFAVILTMGLQPSFGKDTLEDELVRAAAVGEEAKVKDLLARGANVNALSSGPFGTTALMQAAQYGHKNIISILLGQGVDLKSRHTQVALSWSISKSDFEIASMLIERGVDSRVAVVQSCSDGNLKAVNFLLDKGASVNFEDVNGTTPLMAASGSGHSEVAKLLLAQKAGINYQNKDFGMTALMYAASPDGKLEVLRVLAEAGADTNLKTTHGWTALMIAAANGHPDMVKILLTHNADRGIKNTNGQTALDIAVEKGHKELATLLREQLGE